MEEIVKELTEEEFMASLKKGEAIFEGVIIHTSGIVCLKIPELRIKKFSLADSIFEGKIILENGALELSIENSIITGNLHEKMDQKLGIPGRIGIVLKSIKILPLWKNNSVGIIEYESPVIHLQQM